MCSTVIDKVANITNWAKLGYPMIILPMHGTNHLVVGHYLQDNVFVELPCSRSIKLPRSAPKTALDIYMKGALTSQQT